MFPLLQANNKGLFLHAYWCCIIQQQSPVCFDLKALLDILQKVAFDFLQWHPLWIPPWALGTFALRAFSAAVQERAGQLMLIHSPTWTHLSMLPGVRPCISSLLLHRRHNQPRGGSWGLYTSIPKHHTVISIPCRSFCSEYFSSSALSSHPVCASASLLTYSPSVLASSFVIPWKPCEPTFLCPLINSMHKRYWDNWYFLPHVMFSPQPVPFSSISKEEAAIL